MLLPSKRPRLNLAWPPRHTKIRQLLCALIILIFAFASIMAIFGCHNRMRYLPIRHFKWPPYVDVKAEVERQLLGEKPQSFVINDWANFRTLIEPNCTGWEQRGADSNRENEILVLVKTAPDRIEQRDAIRATLSKFNATQIGYEMRIVFVMGSMLNWRTDWMFKLEQEARIWGDMLVGDHQDDYYRSCLKLANSIKLARNFCGREMAMPFVFLLDDDYVLFPWELVNEVRQHSPADRLYSGYCYYDSVPQRILDTKWAVSSREYPFQTYPDYCTGGSVLLTRRTVEEFYLAIQHTEFYVWEDVYTGILAHLLHIRPKHLPKIFGNPKYDEVPSFWFFCNGPWCHDWREVISAHGYSPQEIRDIYGQIHRRWEQEQREEREKKGRDGNHVNGSNQPRPKPVEENRRRNPERDRTGGTPAAQPPPSPYYTR